MPFLAKTKQLCHGLFSKKSMTDCFHAWRTAALYSGLEVWQGKRLHDFPLKNLVDNFFNVVANFAHRKVGIGVQFFSLFFAKKRRPFPGVGARR